MSFPRTVAAVALLVGLLAAAPAGAAQHAPQQHRELDALTTATEVAKRYWGVLPCNGNVRVVARHPLARGLAEGADAWATFDSPLGRNNLAAPASSYTNCKVSLARSRWPTKASMSEDRVLLCATLTHEMGHLLGRVHDLTPGSVMAPIFTDGSSIPQSCRSLPRG